jgi:hypothetical protein
MAGDAASAQARGSHFLTPFNLMWAPAILYPFGLLPRARRRGASAGAGGGVPTERIPRDKPPNLARRGEIVTKTQTATPLSYRMGATELGA